MCATFRDVALYQFTVSRSLTQAVRGALRVDGNPLNSGPHVALVVELHKEAHVFDICGRFFSMDELIWHSSQAGDLMFRLGFL